MPTPEALCGLLAEPARFTTYAAIALGARTAAGAAEAGGLTIRQAGRALAALTGAGLVSGTDGELTADLTVFKSALRHHLATHPPEPLDPDETRDAVLRQFMADGRLGEIPVNRTQRLIVLEHLVACFEPGIRYPEREVTAILRAWHPDHASLRRHLVDECMLSRDHNIYWRTGGPVTT